ncbi:hypothetical protein QBC46DRAFT_230563, partial [Diplogelasinospora grovesii]
AQARSAAQAVAPNLQTCTDSVVRAEDATSKYHTRKATIVYYDGLLQWFFTELVKFVSAVGNRLRKAQMAAMATQVKRRPWLSDEKD